MTIQDMHIRVNTQLQVIGSNAVDEFRPEEIDIYLNRAIEKFIDDRRDLLRTQMNTPEEEGVTDDLRTLINRQVFTNDSGSALSEISDASGFNEAKEIDLTSLSNAYRHYVTSKTSISDGSGGEGPWYNNRFVSPAVFSERSYTNGNSPVFRDFPVTVEKEKLLILPSFEVKDDLGPDITRVLLTYIQDPSTVDLSGGVDCDLPNHVHQDIVNITVELIQRDLGNTRQGGNE